MGRRMIAMLPPGSSVMIGGFSRFSLPASMRR
jgi:hypothetical protein